MRKGAGLTSFSLLRKIDITNKEVLNQCFFCFSSAIFFGAIVSAERDFTLWWGWHVFPQKRLNNFMSFSKWWPTPWLRKGVTLFRDSLEMYVRLTQWNVASATNDFRKSYFTRVKPRKIISRWSRGERSHKTVRWMSKHSSLLTDCPSELYASRALADKRKKEGYITHGVDALTKVSDEGRRRLR